VRAVLRQINEASSGGTEVKRGPKEDYKEGALAYKRFILLPERYRDREAILRIRFDGKFGTWLVREALFDAYGLNRGDTLFCNDISVLGVDYSDIDDDSVTIDMFAEGKCADWILDNELTVGSIVEVKCSFAYEFVQGPEREGYKKAVLIMKEGLRIIGKGGRLIGCDWIRNC